MQNKNCKAYLDGIRDLRAMIKREGGNSKSSSKESKKVAAENLKDFRRMWLNLAREIELARLKRRQGGEAYRRLDNKEAEAVRIKYAQKAHALMSRGLIESY